MRSRTPQPLVALSLVFAFAHLAGCSSESPDHEAVKGADVSKESSPSVTPSPERSDDLPVRHLAGTKPGKAIWTLMTPNANPSDSNKFAMAFDVHAGVSVLYHPKDEAMWTWDGSDWTRHPWPEGQPSPGNSRDTRIVYDIERKRIVLYGGIDGSDCWRCKDTWEWFDGAWTKRGDVAGAGNGRNGHDLVYDSINKVTVLTGGIYGRGPEGDSDTWTYDGTSSWVEKVAPDAGYLPGRWLHATAFDSDRGKVVLFGGASLSYSETFSDIWEYDGTSWVQMTPSGPVPTRRHESAMAYDSVRKVTVVYGGMADPPEHDSVHWEWDGTSWRKMTFSDPNPGIRHSAGFVFDSGRKRFVLFGDIHTAGLNDTWEMYVRGNSCVTADDCHTGFCVDGVCCETACDGTCEACASELTGDEDGVCAPVLPDTDPDGDCTEGVGADATCAPGTCDGAGSCTIHAGVTCQPDGCSDDTTVQPAGTCNASGVCELPDSIPCGPGEICIDAVCVPGGEDPDAGDEDAGLDAGDEDAGDEDAGLDAGDDDAGDDAGSDAGVDDAGVDAAPPVDAGDELVPTTTTLSTSAPLVEEGAAFEIEVKVRADEGIPTGTVTVRDAEVTIGSATLEEGEARITISLTGVGAHELVAFYPGSDIHAPSISSPLVVTVDGEGPGEYRILGGGCSAVGGVPGSAGHWALIGAAVVMAVARRRRDGSAVSR